ncbi:MAG TPA: chemotaxis protein CheW [Blastocatellia bacterium]|nr:chemotaxis protein CheW [Blastocatellia bacterium]
MIEDRALLNEYLSETEELLDSLLADLDALAARGGAEPDTNLINRIFRTAHSLKGILGMMGLAEVQSLAHEFEDLLDDIRLDRLAWDERAAAALQEAGAGLAALVSGAARGAVSEEDLESLRHLLAAISARSRELSKKEAESVEALGLSERERRMLTEYEEHRILENLSAGRFFYSICAQFAVGDLDKKYRALSAKLADGGELITTLPEKADKPTDVALKFIFATQLKEAEIKRLAKPFDGRVARLGQSPWRRAGEALRVVGRRQKKPDDSNAPAESRINILLPASFAQESLQPLTPSVRVELSRIDELSGLAHELAIETQRLSAMARRFLAAAGLGAGDRFDLRQSAQRIEREFLELEERLVELRMVSLAQTFTRAARLARRLARELSKSVTVEVEGGDTQIDKMIVDRIADPIYHILRNALDHGIELPGERRRAGKSGRGRVKIAATLEGTRTVIAISDDGRGIDLDSVRRRAVEIGAISADDQLSEEETLRLITWPGFSTADRLSEVSGRGVGLDAVERAVHELGGELRIFSEEGKGSRFELAVPTTLVLVSAFIVRASEWRYAINVGQIIELLYVNPTDILGRDGKRNVNWRGMTIPMVELCYLLGLGGARVLHPPNGGSAASANPAEPRVPVFIARAMDRHVAVAVEQFVEQREIIVKSLGSLSRRMKGVSGAVDLEGGDVALVLDLPSLLLNRSLRL